MRTITTIVTTTLYTFDELSDNAKARVREQYLNSQDVESFTDGCKMYIDELLPNSNLDVQFSLNYCQCDGFNIYGEFSLIDLANVLEDKFTEKEKRFLKWAFEETGINSYKMPMNRHYCYCTAYMHDFTEDLFDALDYDGMRDIRKDTLEKMTREARIYIEKLCRSFENDGYKYFYEVSDDELKEWANDFEYEFTENGDIY